MAQCVGRSQRTGERCKRSAAAGASTCYYHGQTVRVRAAPRRVESDDPARRSSRPAFTTKVLSKRTYDDFETLFAVGTGGGGCAYLFALDPRRATRGGSWRRSARRTSAPCAGSSTRAAPRGSSSTTTGRQWAGASSSPRTSCASPRWPRDGHAELLVHLAARRVPERLSSADPTTKQQQSGPVPVTDEDHALGALVDEHHLDPERPRLPDAPPRAVRGVRGGPPAGRHGEASLGCP